MTDDSLQDLAGQLRQPSGDKGKDIALMMHETNIGMTKHAIDHLKLINGDHILELGHGNCGHLAYLMQQALQLRYQGLELSALMQEEAQRLNEAFVTEQLASFNLYDGSHIPFPDQSFNKIFTVNTIYFWTDPLGLLSELYRVLQTGGICCITFGQASFMEQLPFTRFGFELYDTDKASKLIAKTSFRLTGIANASEPVKSKAGDVVTRHFTTMILSR